MKAICFRVSFLVWMQTIILISQIRVNSMAIVRMKSVDDPPDQFRKLTSVGDALTSSLEQVNGYATTLPYAYQALTLSFGREKGPIVHWHDYQSYRFPWVKLYIKLPVCSTILACQTFMHIFFRVLCLYEQQSMCQQVVPWSCPTVLRYQPFSALTHFLHSPCFWYKNMNVLDSQ